MLGPFRRIVTAHDDRGKTYIQSDEQPDNERPRAAGRITLHEIWTCTETPVKIARRGQHPPDDKPILIPPKGGNRFRMVDFPPLEGSGNMHRSETLEYCIMLEGETYLETETDKTLVKAGDVVVLRGTNHAWSNRSDRWCRMAIVSVDGEYVDGLEGQGAYSAFAERQAAEARADKGAS
jgi:quercetin dioxygenase-like cupin family protein